MVGRSRREAAKRFGVHRNMITNAKSLAIARRITRLQLSVPSSEVYFASTAELAKLRALELAMRIGSSLASIATLEATLPSDQPSSHSAPMEGGGAYNRGAAVQAAHADSVLHLLEAAARRVPLDATDAPLVLADYGCSQGVNSLAPMRAAIAALREGAGRDRPIWVVNNDQPGNDFASLFGLLENDSASYLRDEANVFDFAVGRSFFKRILPPGSVALGWSSNSVHWLSRIPEPVPDGWHASATEISEVQNAYARQIGGSS
jgi:SAM dependent carboxyl methyltransferase